jgi:hypothetical protein
MSATHAFELAQWVEHGEAILARETDNLAKLDQRIAATITDRDRAQAELEAAGRMVMEARRRAAERTGPAAWALDIAVDYGDGFGHAGNVWGSIPPTYRREHARWDRARETVGPLNTEVNKLLAERTTLAQNLEVFRDQVENWRHELEALCGDRAGAAA